MRNVSITHAKALEERQKQLTTQLSEQQVKELKEAFSIFDKNGDGGISNDELRIFLETLGMNDQLLAPLLPSLPYIKSPFLIRVLINSLKPSSKKFLSFFSGQKPSDKDIARLMAEVDEDGNGEIDFDEFLQMMVRFTFFQF